MSQTRAEQLKSEGNTHFTEGRYAQAVEQYSRAIQHDASNPVLFTNRALAYLHMQNHEQAASDCERAIDLGDKRYKPHFVLGQALASLGRLAVQEAADGCAGAGGVAGAQAHHPGAQCP